MLKKYFFGDSENKFNKQGRKRVESESGERSKDWKGEEKHELEQLEGDSSTKCKENKRLKCAEQKLYQFEK